MKLSKTKIHMLNDLDHRKGTWTEVVEFPKMMAKNTKSCLSITISVLRACGLVIIFSLQIELEMLSSPEFKYVRSWVYRTREPLRISKFKYTSAHRWLQKRGGVCSGTRRTRQKTGWSFRVGIEEVLTKPLGSDSVILPELQTTLVCMNACLEVESTCEVKTLVRQLTCEANSVSCCKPKNLHQKIKK